MASDFMTNFNTVVNTYTPEALKPMAQFALAAAKNYDKFTNYNLDGLAVSIKPSFSASVKKLTIGVKF